MTKLLGFQKKFTILLISFLLSCIHRTSARQGNVDTNGRTFNVPAQHTSEGLALWFARGASGPNEASPGGGYILELNKFFPWVHLNRISVDAVPVSVVPLSLLAGAAVPELRNLTVSSPPSPQSCSPSAPPPSYCPIYNPACPIGLPPGPA